MSNYPKRPPQGNHPNHAPFSKVPTSYPLFPYEIVVMSTPLKSSWTDEGARKEKEVIIVPYKPEIKEIDGEVYEILNAQTIFEQIKINGDLDKLKREIKADFLDNMRISQDDLKICVRSMFSHLLEKKSKEEFIKAAKAEVLDKSSDAHQKIMSAIDIKLEMVLQEPDWYLSVLSFSLSCNILYFYCFLF
jgi:hypothetical protein